MLFPIFVNEKEYGMTRDELYEKLNPNVHIVYEFAGWNDYWTKLTTMAAGGQLPDVMQQDYARLAEWQGKNLLYPLDDFVKNKVINTDNVADTLLASGRSMVNCTLSTWDPTAKPLFWIRTLFKRRESPYPDPKWTWADFEKIATALHDKLGIYGGPIAVDNEQLWKSLYLGLGQWAYSKDGKSLGYTDDAPFVAYLRWWFVWLKRG